MAWRISAGLTSTIILDQVSRHALKQALAEGAQSACEQLRRFAAEEADHGHRRLLRTCRERPRRRRAAEQRDELASPVNPRSIKLSSNASRSHLGSILCMTFR